MKRTIKNGFGILLCAVLLFSAAFARAEAEPTVEELYSRIEAAAEAGDYDTAQALYDQLMLADVKNAHLQEAYMLVVESLRKQADMLASARQKEPGGIQVLETLARMDNPTEVVFGDTAALGDAVSFSVPADWEKLDIDEGMDTAFQYRGTDEEGRLMFFAGMMFENIPGPMESVISQLYEVFNHVYSFVSVNGIDMMLAGDGTTAVGFCFTEDGKAMCFGFSFSSLVQPNTQELLQGSFADIMQSDKLKRDMAAILLSVTAADPAVMLSLPENEPSF